METKQFIRTHWLNISLVVFFLSAISGTVMYVSNIMREGRVLGVIEGVEMDVPEWYGEPLTAMKGDNMITVTPLTGQRIAAKKEGKRYIYKNVYPHTDVIQTDYGFKVKEEMIFHKPGHPTEFRYRLGNLEAYIVEEDPDGNLVFYDKRLYSKFASKKSLAKVFIMPSPFVEDSRQSRSFSVTASIEGNELIVKINRSWLRQAYYPITLDPTIEISVLNVQSYPIVGGEWQIDFTTQGEADLNIIGDVKTIFNENVEFVELSCDGAARAAESAGNGIKYDSWSCDGIGTLRLKVLTPGKHTLTFTFGGQTAYAYNDASGLNQVHYRWRNDDGGEKTIATTISETGSATNGATSGTNITITHGLTINENDVVLVFIHANVSGNTISDNNGVYAFTADIEEDGSDTSRYGIFSRVAGSSEPATYNFTLNSSDDWSIAVRVFSGVDTSSIWDKAPSASTRDAGLSSTATAVGISTSNDGAMGIVFVFTDSGAGITYSNPSNGYGTEVEPSSGWPQASYIQIWSTAGTTGSVNVTMSASNDWTIHHIALKPSPPTELAATWNQPEDTKLKIERNDPRRLRLEVSNTSGSGSGNVSYRLEAAKADTCSGGSYSPVTASSGGDWQIVDSSNINNGFSTVNIAGGLTDNTTTFVAGETLDATNTTGVIVLANTEFTEIEYSLKAADSAEIGANYCFRLYDTTGGVAIGTYGQYAEAEVVVPKAILEGEMKFEGEVLIE